MTRVRRKQHAGSEHVGCGGRITVSDTQFGPRYACSKCTSYSWSDRRPLVDRRTHELRRKAHEEFDVVWRSGLTSRTDAYARLARPMGAAIALVPRLKQDIAGSERQWNR